MDSAPYLELLEKTDAAARDAPPPGSEAEASALAAFRKFFENMTPEQVEAEIANVYAGDAWLYDTLALHNGLEEIRPYFIATARRAAAVRVEVLDLLRNGHEFYLKWQMDIDWSSFKSGKTTRSFGMSHLRFNEDGRVILHYDFWDSGHGFFEHLPLIGSAIRAVKRKVRKV
ncbi:MAG TPA: nuclear transport factor 2 family protein [Oceanipulchritudo sp.]|nr:nuclear transport factor 2 family protein [Oceanipulchritudo sp.]